jgi:hypothetical protein
VQGWNWWGPVPALKKFSTNYSSFQNIRIFAARLEQQI